MNNNIKKNHNQIKDILKTNLQYLLI